MTPKQKTAFQTLVAMSGLKLNEDEQLEVFEIVKGILEDDKGGSHSVERLVNKMGYIMQQVPMFEVQNKQTTFKNSPLFEQSVFESQFKGVEFDGVDLNHYYHILVNWGNKSGKRRTPRAWISTVRNIMMADKQKGKLVMKNNGMDVDIMKTFNEI